MLVMTNKIYRYLPIAAVAVTASVACATSGNANFQSTSGSTQSGSTGSLSNSFSVPINDATISNTTPDGAMGPDADDSGLSFGADGAVVGTCVVGRTCTTCDELKENGVSEYIEPKPDDGSALPTGPLSSLDALFTGAASSGGPCIVDPPNGALFPNNWLRPRIFFQPSVSQTLFQIRIHTSRQMNDLVVYTRSTSWEIPLDIWKALAASTWAEDITVTVSASSGSGSAASSSTTFQIAPANANGSMVYWAAVGDKNGLSWLEAFGVGDEGVTQVLRPSQVQSKLSRDQGGNLTTRDPDNNVTVAAGSDLCIGCHVAAPDRQSVAFLDFYPWPGVTARIDGTNSGALPTWLTPGGGEAFSQPWLGMLSFSSGDWGAGHHRVISTYAIASSGLPWNGQGYSGPSITPRLAWFDLSSAAATVLTPATTNPTQESAMAALAGTSFGFIATGDTRGAESPAWSHDGSTVVYASTDVGKDGRLAGDAKNTQTGMSDLYAVPFNNGSGGTAKPLAGAATSTYDEFYPSFSPDDSMVAFTRVPNADGIRYYAPKAEVFVVPSGGGTATRLAANDPPACQKQINTKMSAASPGVTNSWPRWSPEYPTCSDGKTYYWLIFSSSRLGIPFTAANFKAGLLYTIPISGSSPANEPTSQLYLTAVVTGGSTSPQTFPATYIWNQPISSSSYGDGGGPSAAQSNHTPSWDVVEIQPPPRLPPPPPPPPPR